MEIMKILLDEFKNIIVKANDRVNSNIKIIAIILNIFKKDGEFYCEVFDDRDNTWINFNRRDIEKIREIIKFQL